MQYFFYLTQIISLGIFVLFVIAKTAYLNRKEKISAIKINIFAPGAGKHLFEILMFLSVLVWSFILLIYFLNKAFDIRLNIPGLILFDITALKIFGILLEFCGFVIFIIALINMGNSWRLGIDDKNPGKLVTSGIFSISRHPIYLFFNLYFFGAFFVSGDLIFIIFAILLLFVMHIQMLREEHFLLSVYGSAYKDYMDNVSRYFTFKLFYNFKKTKYPFRVAETRQEEQA